MGSRKLQILSTIPFKWLLVVPWKYLDAYYVQHLHSFVGEIWCSSIFTVELLFSNRKYNIKNMSNKHMFEYMNLLNLCCKQHKICDSLSNIWGIISWPIVSFWNLIKNHVNKRDNKDLSYWTYRQTLCCLIVNHNTFKS